MKVSAYAKSDIGRKREENQDAYAVNEELKLYVVADGMGGHAAGALASQLAIDVFVEDVEAAIHTIEQAGKDDSGRCQITQVLEDAVRRAGVSIYQEAQAKAGLRGMGTTLSALLITPNRGFIAHVGDSRIYLIREEEVVQLTEDHSLLNQLIKQGRIHPSQAKSNKYSNAITRAVGVYPDVQVDTLDFELASDDAFLLCSDGLSQYFEDATELGSTIKSHGLTIAPDVLVAMANHRGGSDNTTVILVRVSNDANKRQSPEPLDVSSRVKLLQKMPLFQHLTYVEVVEILNVSESRNYATGDFVFRDQELGEEMFVILSGKVGVYKDDVRLAKLGTGGHFGEMAIMDKGSRSADIKAERDTRVLCIHRKQLFALMRRDKEISVKLLWCFVQVLNRRLRSTLQDLLKATIGYEEAEGELPDWEEFSSLE